MIWARCSWKITWLFQLLGVHQCLRHLFKVSNTKMVYKIFLHVRFQTLLLLFTDKSLRRGDKKKSKKS